MESTIIRHTRKRSKRFLRKKRIEANQIRFKSLDITYLKIKCNYIHSKFCLSSFAAESIALPLANHLLIFLLVLEIINLDFVAYKADSRPQADVVPVWSFIRSQRGAPLILYEGFVYRCERKISTRTYWLCTKYKGYKCNARLILNGNCVSKATDHNHAQDERANEASTELKNLDDDDVDDWLKATPKLSN